MACSTEGPEIGAGTGAVTQCSETQAEQNRGLMSPSAGTLWPPVPFAGSFPIVGWDKRPPSSAGPPTTAYPHDEPVLTLLARLTLPG